MNCPLVSIIVSNYNYGRFLGEAIDSALNQTYPNIEVIVVDDGSTDDSRAVIERYRDRIVPMLKENGGQASAVNVGFELSQGKIVNFLDADDVLLPDIIQKVVASFRSDSSVVRVQFRQRIVDAHGKSTGELRPPGHIGMPTGDLRPMILKSHSYWTQVTSANAYSSEVLGRVLPIPEDLYRLLPDVYINDLTPLFGSIVSLDDVGVLYRVHGKNHYASSAFAINLPQVIDLPRLREQLVAVADARARQRDLFNSLYSVGIRETGSRDLSVLSRRVISLKLDPLNHPFKESLPRLCARGCILSLTHPYPGLYRWFQRPLHALWFAAMLMSPQHLAKPLAEMFLYREKRGRLFNRLIAFLRKAV